MAQRMNVEYIRLYTVGSAALKLESALPEQKYNTQKLPHKAKKIKLYIDPVAILSICVAVCMIVLMFVGFTHLHRAQVQVEVMQSYVDRLEVQHATLSNEYKEGYNLDQIRQSALEMQMIPAQQAAHISLYIPEEPEQVAQITLWDRIGTFLTGLFA